MTLVTTPQVNKGPFLGVGRAAWTLSVLVLWLCQGILTRAALERFHYEDLAESIRNPYWLSHHILYDGTSSNVGWYGTLLALYETFGFSLSTAKVFRWALQLPSLLCLAALLRRHLPENRGLVLLWLVGLSPTLQFFTSMQTSFGIDLQLVPILLWLLVQPHVFDVGPRGGLWNVVVGVLVMWGSFSYPVMLLYGPPLAALYLFLWHRSGTSPRALVQGVVGVVGGMAVVLGGALAWLRYPMNLLRDPHSGEWSLFVGGGGAMHLHPRVLHWGMVKSFTDLFVRPLSYAFDLPHVEFGTPLGWIGVGVITVVTLQQYRQRWSRRDVTFWVLSVALLAFFVGLIMPHTSQNTPGLRRATPMLVGAWAAAGVLLALPPTERAARAMWRACQLLVLHHVVVFPLNVVDLAQLPRSNDHFLGLAGTPSESLSVVMERVARGEPLRCEKLGGECRYSEIYGALSGYRRWNDLPLLKVTAWDPDRQELLELTPSVWESYRLAH
ncbi:MAG: hypothetical protein AB2A00_27450 [Myxococcota bacterium]